MNELTKIPHLYNPLTLWDSMTKGKVSLELLEQISEEFREDFNKIADALELGYNRIESDVFSDYVYCAKRINFDPRVDDFKEFRKLLGLLLKEETLDHNDVMFLMFYNVTRQVESKDIDRYIMRQIRPKANIIGDI